VPDKNDGKVVPLSKLLQCRQDPAGGLIIVQAWGEETGDWVDNYQPCMNHLNCLLEFVQAVWEHQVVDQDDPGQVGSCGIKV